MPISLAGRLSVVASAFGADPRQAALAARIAGFSGTVFDAYGSIDLTELSITGRREWLRILTQQGQRLTALQIDLGRNGLGPGADVERQLQRIGRAMDVAVELQAGVLCVELGLLPRARLVTPPRVPIASSLLGSILLPEAAPVAAAEVLPPPDPAFVTQVEYALTELGSRADRSGTMLAFSSALSSVHSLHAAIAGPACPWFGIDVDPVGLLRDGVSIDDAFSLVGHAIRHVRLRDAIAGDEHRTRPVVVGSGNVNWPAFLSAVEAAGYSGMMTVDPIDLANRPAAAKEAIVRITQTAERL